MKTRKKGQTWSTDAIIAVSLFIGVLIVFFYIAGFLSQGQKYDELTAEGEKIPQSLTFAENVSGLAFIEGTKVDRQKLDALAAQDYAEIKKKLGVTNDFCLHFEDEDGNLVRIDGKVGLGSDKVLLNGTPCSSVPG